MASIKCSGDKEECCICPGIAVECSRMKPVCRLVILLLTSLAVVSGSASVARGKSTADSGVVNRVAATVNGRPITAGEVRARLGPYFRELMMLYPRQGPRFNSELVKAKKAVLDELIDRELVLSEFETKGYMLQEDQIESEINRRILTAFNGNRKEFLDNLRKSGMTYSEYRDSVRKEITVASMRASRYDRGIPPTPDEIRAEYNATRHEYRNIMNDVIAYDKIFIPAADPEDPMLTAEDQYKLAVKLRQQLDMGEISFAEAARRHSRDAQADNGGVWPKMKRSDLAVDFANVVFSAKPGKIIGPLLDPHGFTIVKVRSRNLAPAPPLSNPEVKRQVDDAVRRRQSEKRYREWVERLRERAVIRRFI